MGQSGGYKNESGTLKCPTTTTTTACQVKWAPQMSGASLFQCLRLRSPTRSLMRLHSKDLFGRGNILLFKSFRAVTLNASGLSHPLLSLCVCVLVCVLCWLNANNVEHMNLRLKHVRNYEKLPQPTRLGPTPTTALYIYVYIYVCVCVGVYIYFDKFI